MTLLALLLPLVVLPVVLTLASSAFLVQRGAGLRLWGDRGRAARGLAGGFAPAGLAAGKDLALVLLALLVPGGVLVRFLLLLRLNEMKSN